MADIKDKLVQAVNEFKKSLDGQTISITGCCQQMLCQKCKLKSFMISTNCIFCRTSEDIDYMIRITDNRSNIDNNINNENMENMENMENSENESTLLLNTPRIDNNRIKYVHRVLLSGTFCILFYLSAFDARNHIKI